MPAAARAQEGENQGFPPSCESSFFLFSTAKFADMRPLKERQRIFLLPHGRTSCAIRSSYPQCQIPFVRRHRPENPKRAKVRHNSAAQPFGALSQTGPAKITYSKRLIRRCRAQTQLNESRNTVMLRLRRFNRMCSSTLSDTANRLKKTRKKKSSAVLLFSQRSPLSDFRWVKK